MVPVIRKLVDVSIHAPVRVRPDDHLVLGNPIGFNPRTREGATIFRIGFNVKDKVSIHAPVRVRHVTLASDKPITVFQSTHP